MSFGQTMVIVLGALGSMVAMFYLTSQTGSTGGGGGGGGATQTVTNNTTTISMLFAIAALRVSDVDIVATGRKVGAALWVVGWIVTWPVTAFLFEGVLMGLIVAIIMSAVALLLPVGIALAGPSIPKSIGLVLARGHWILAQLTVDRGILVRRETGEYEHHKLYESDPSISESFEESLKPNERVDEHNDDLSFSAQFADEDEVVFVSLEAGNEIEAIDDASLTVIAHGEHNSQTVLEGTALDIEHNSAQKGVFMPDETASELPDDDDDDSGWLGWFGSDDDDDGLGDIERVEVVLEVDAQRDIDHEFEAHLSDGTTLPVHGSEGDLYRFAWSPLGITEEKGAANMSPITQTPPSDLAADGGRIASDNTRQSYRPLLKIPDQDQWLVTLPQLWSWCQNTSESETIEQGRDKALSEHGGAQQVSMIAFSVIVLASVVVGGLFGWIAAGGLG